MTKICWLPLYSITKTVHNRSKMIFENTNDGIPNSNPFV